MRNIKAIEKFAVFLGLCIGGKLTSQVFIDAFFPDPQSSFLNGSEENTSSIERAPDGSVNKSSILCWVMTTPKRKGSALAVKNTWGKRCDKLIFFADKLDDGLESVKLSDVQEEWKYLWSKTREALKYLYDHYLDDFDWFYKADDDTYVIVENLRYVLTPYDPEFPIGLGERAIVNGNKTRRFLGGGAGYVLSRGTLRIYGNVTYHNNSLCPANHQGGEDVVLGHCLTNSGILFGDSRDELGRHRFHQKPPRDYIKGTWQILYPNTMIYPYGKGIDSISETAVSFHTLKDESHLYTLEFFIYKLQLFGVEGRFKGPQIAPHSPPDISAVHVEVLERFQKPKVNESGSEMEENKRESQPE